MYNWLPFLGKNSLTKIQYMYNSRLVERLGEFFSTIRKFSFIRHFSTNGNISSVTNVWWTYVERRRKLSNNDIDVPNQINIRDVNNFCVKDLGPATMQSFCFANL